MIEIARQWKERGISPIPVMFQGKRPLVKWKVWKEKTPPEYLMRAWFRERVNLGLVLSHGLNVIDFDEKDAYGKWVEENPSLAKTFTVQSYRGSHVYVWSNAQRIYRIDGGDLKGDGLITAPPSVHVTGKKYQIVVDQPILKVDDMSELGVLIQGPVEVPIFEYSQVDENPSSPVGRIKSNLPIIEFFMRIGEPSTYNRKCCMMCCPFHPDRNPSLAIYPMEDVCYCFSTRCRAHRRTDVIDAASMYWNVSVQEAIKRLLAWLDGTGI